MPDYEVESIYDMLLDFCFDEEDYIGFVPETDIPIYCQSSFKNHKVDDFRHYNPDIHKKILRMIEWQAYPKIELLE